MGLHRHPLALKTIGKHTVRNFLVDADLKTRAVNSQTHAEGNTRGFLGLEITLIVIGICVALAALRLQIQSNQLAKESIEATEKGNAAAVKSYKLQL